jgi:hypothetical protein
MLTLGPAQTLDELRRRLKPPFHKAQKIIKKKKKKKLSPKYFFNEEKIILFVYNIEALNKIRTVIQKK